MRLNGHCVASPLSDILFVERPKLYETMDQHDVGLVIAPAELIGSKFVLVDPGIERGAISEGNWKQVISFDGGGEIHFGRIDRQKRAAVYLNLHLRSLPVTPNLHCRQLLPQRVSCCWVAPYKYRGKQEWHKSPSAVSKLTVRFPPAMSFGGIVSV